MLRARMRPRLPARGSLQPCVRQSSNNASRSQPRQPGSSFKPRRPSTGAASQAGAQSFAQSSPSSSSSSTSATSKQSLPAVPVLSTHPSIVISDAFFAGDRPLLELGIPPSQRQNSSRSNTEQSRSLDDMLEDALEWFDPRHSSQGKSAASASGSEPTVKREPAAAATEELSRHTPFVAPHQHHKRKLSQRRQRLMARFDQAEHFLSSVHTRLDHPSQDARMALDSFFHHGQKLADLLPSKKDKQLSSAQQGSSSSSKEAKQLTAEDVTELMHITQAAMEHWKTDSDGSSRLFTMEKDADTGVWSTTEGNPSAKPASSNAAHMTVDEDADSDLDLAADEGEQILVVDHRGNQQMFGSDFNNPAADSSRTSSKVPQSLAQAISSFVNALPSETAHEQPASPSSSTPAVASSASTASPTARESIDGKRPAGGMGRRISLGPRLSTIRGGRAIPRVRRSLEQLLGWTSAGIRADSVKKKRKRKMSKHKYKKRRKATRALRKKLGK